MSSESSLVVIGSLVAPVVAVAAPPVVGAEVTSSVATLVGPAVIVADETPVIPVVVVVVSDPSVLQARSRAMNTRGRTELMIPIMGTSDPGCPI